MRGILGIFWRGSLRVFGEIGVWRYNSNIIKMLSKGSAKKSAVSGIALRAG